MSDVAAAVIGTACLCHAGMAALSLAMDRHYEQVTGRREIPPLQQVLLRVLGVTLLAGGLVCTVTSWGAVVGPLVWLGFVTGGALLVAWGLPYAPRWGAWAAAMTGVAGLAMAWRVN